MPPVPEAARPPALADAAGYGYCKSHSATSGECASTAASGSTAPPRGAILWSADRPEREVALELLPRVLCGGELVICDKGYAARRDEPPARFNLAPIRRIEAVYQTLKDLLTLERHGAPG